jgi:hypothetical protein
VVMMKGQMFIITALIMIVVIVGLKNTLSFQNILENQRHLVAGFDFLEFGNIRTEMINVLQMSYNSPTNMTNNLNNFNGFVHDVLSTKTVEFDSLLVETYYPLLLASTNTVVNVTVYNSLGTDMKFLNLTFNGASQTFSLSDRNILRTGFTLNTGVSNNQTLTIFYNTSSASQTETVIIPATIGNSKYVAFFDIRYISNRGQQSDKFTNTITLS